MKCFDEPDGFIGYFFTQIADDTDVCSGIKSLCHLLYGTYASAYYQRHMYAASHGADY